VGWRPSSKDAAPWWQVDLGAEFILTGVVTQGGYESDARSQARRAGWVSKYTLQSSLDGATWDPYGSEMAGNTDAETPVLREINMHTVEPLRARYLRILPVECGRAASPDGTKKAEAGPVAQLSGACTLRVEVMGHTLCKRSKCAKPAGLGAAAGGVLPAASFVASSRARSSTPAHAGRLHGKQSVFREGGWSPGCPAAAPGAAVATPGAAVATPGAAAAAACKMPARPEASLDYLQIDLGSEQQINAVATQGSASRPSWVTAYDVAFSNDGRHWAKANKRFTGNADAVQAVKNTLPRPVLARYVRIIPVAWDGVGPEAEQFSLRAEVYGPAGYRPGEVGCRLQAGLACPCSDNSQAIAPKEAPGAKPKCGCGRTIPAVLRGRAVAVQGGVAVPAEVVQ